MANKYMRAGKKVFADIGFESCLFAWRNNPESSHGVLSWETWSVVSSGGKAWVEQKYCPGNLRVVR